MMPTHLHHTVCTAAVVLAVALASPSVAQSLAAPEVGARFRLAMHDMMPMSPQGSGSTSSGMMDDNMMRMQPMPQGSMGQGSTTGGMQAQGSASGQMGGGMMGGGMMRDNRMQSGPMGGMQMQSPGQTGGMGTPQSGMQMQSPDQMGMGGQMGMMGEHMRMMNEQMRMRGMMSGMTMGPSMVDLTDRIEGRIAFLRAELRVTDTQAPAWNTFADAVRSSRKHLMEARQVLNQPYATPADRLEQYERHLSARLEALKSARAAFAQLYATLDEGQKRTADELVLPFIATF